MGVRPKKKLFPKKLRKTIPDSVVTFFFHFWAPYALTARKGPMGLVGWLVGCLLARRASSTLVSDDLINRLKYYVLQLSDPYQDLILGPSWGGCFYLFSVSIWLFSFFCFPPGQCGFGQCWRGKLVLVEFVQEKLFWSLLASKTGIWPKHLSDWSDLSRKSSFGLI